MSHLSLRLLAFGSDRIDLVNENDGGRVGRRVLKGLSKSLRCAGEDGSPGS